LFYYEGTLNSTAAVQERRRVCQELGILKECHAKYVIDVVTHLPCSKDPVSQQEQTRGNKRTEENVEKEDEDDNEESKDDEEDVEKEDNDEEDDDFITPPPTPSYKPRHKPYFASPPTPLRRPLTQKPTKRRKLSDYTNSQKNLMDYFFTQ